jgi:hypothetical protein
MDRDRAKVSEVRSGFGFSGLARVLVADRHACGARAKPTRRLALSFPAPSA